MLVPSIFGESLLDDFVNDFAFPYAPAKKVYGKEAASLMRTDVKETKTGYELEIELPGVTARRRRSRTVSTSVRSATAAPPAGASMWERISPRKTSRPNLKMAC